MKRVGDRIVYGKVIDEETRCEHYHSERDIVAIKFRCCNKYYPCYLCHNESEDHAIRVWDQQEFDTQGILCGGCKQELTINEYLHAENCPYCEALFNPGCSTHYHLYFDMEGS